MTTADRCVEICQEASKHGKQATACYHGQETAVVTVENPERVMSVGSDLVPSFYVVKIHKGSIVNEQFV